MNFEAQDVEYGSLMKVVQHQINRKLKYFDKVCVMKIKKF